MWDIFRYTPDHKEEWNEFVAASRNATFLFDRSYMDYHSDRFADCSWMVYKKGRLLCMLPANIDEEGVLHSHQGLTYGGWLLPEAHIDGGDLLEIFREAIRIWKKQGIHKLRYKPIPGIYSRRPSEEDLYALFRLGAHIDEASLSAAIRLGGDPGYNKLRRRALAKAERMNPIVRETEDVVGFMALVEECLKDRHNARPVHTIEEMRGLKGSFPDRIRMFVTTLPGSNTFEAGVMIYDTGIVAHAQYIATTRKGREENLLTILFDRLIKDLFADREYFDFGISTEDGGRYLNEGLLRQKYSYGATGVATSVYVLDL